MAITKECDVIIVGGGPAGLCAAINGASERLRVVMMEQADTWGGQAARSSMIRNYPGFPCGITGEELMASMTEQAAQFEAGFCCPTAGAHLQVDGRRFVVSSDDDEFVARAVIIATGLSYNKHDANGIAELMGRGVQYGVPMNLPSTGAYDLFIVGGANSAGQAALGAAMNPQARVTILARKPLETQMSGYLIDHIKTKSNIQVMEGVEVVAASGHKYLQEITLRHIGEGTTSTVPATNLCFFIGAKPRTKWVSRQLLLSDKGFILTGPELFGTEPWKPNRRPFERETCVPGVFACGDVREGSTKRVAAAVGDGAHTLQMVHNYLAL